MKHILPSTWVGIVAGLTSIAAASPGQAILDTPTYEEAALARRKALRTEPVKHLVPATGEDPSNANRPKDILAESDIISYRGLATLVPKRAILMTPKTYSGLLRFEPGAKFVSWIDFYAANRGWITTVEVSRIQAEGNAPIAEETQKSIGTSRNLVVATFKGGPISVLPLKEPDPKDSQATHNPSK
jgi:hypothetical protein